MKLKFRITNTLIIFLFLISSISYSQKIKWKTIKPLIESGKYQEAKPLLIKLVKKKKSAYYAYYQLGVTYQNLFNETKNISFSDSSIYYLEYAKNRISDNYLLLNGSKLYPDYTTLSIYDGKKSINTRIRNINKKITVLKKEEKEKEKQLQKKREAFVKDSIAFVNCLSTKKEYLMKIKKMDSLVYDSLTHLPEVHNYEECYKNNKIISNRYHILNKKSEKYRKECYDVFSKYMFIYGVYNKNTSEQSLDIILKKEREEFSKKFPYGEAKSKSEYNKIKNEYYERYKNLKLQYDKFQNKMISQNKYPNNPKGTMEKFVNLLTNLEINGYDKVISSNYYTKHKSLYEPLCKDNIRERTKYINKFDPSRNGLNKFLSKNAKTIFLKNEIEAIIYYEMSDRYMIIGFLKENGIWKIVNMDDRNLEMKNPFKLFYNKY